MSEESNTDKVRIKAILESRADAFRRHDLPAILADHDSHVVMFDLPPPLQCKGIEAHEQTWDLLFRYHKPGTAFDLRELAVTAGRDVAFAFAIMWCGPDSSSDPADKDGFLFRLTGVCARSMVTGASRMSTTPCLQRLEFAGAFCDQKGIIMAANRNSPVSRHDSGLTRRLFRGSSR